MSSFFKSLIGLTIGITIGYIVVSNSESLYPNDFSRTRIIIDSLREGNARVVLFGNSILMNGIDANKFEKITYNLGSSGQRITESFMLYQELSDDVEHVIQFVDAVALLDSTRTELNYQTILNYKSKGYFPDFNTCSHMDSSTIQTFSEIDYLDELKFNRSKFQGSVNSYFRDVFQKKTLSSQKFKEVKAPYIYTENLPSNKVLELVKLHQPGNILDSFSINDKMKYKLKKVSSYLKSRDIKYTLIISPIHPKMNHYKKSFYYDLSNYDFKDDQINVYNWSQMLNENEFVDHAHPNAIGRIKMTHELKRLVD